ncbi:hypothetical protein PGQ11_009787 [Apiospora arundinis]|uniref:Uncharacterized protein n=1 Tax=Apiospora arundinis TaxID=335852 RepID=A0ABR2I7H5_9PEZI
MRQQGDEAPQASEATTRNSSLTHMAAAVARINFGPEASFDKTAMAIASHHRREWVGHPRVHRCGQPEMRSFN